ncbi:TPA: hypothetical protein ACHO1X_004682, partial [Klebsiella michiganensis]
QGHANAWPCDLNPLFTKSSQDSIFQLPDKKTYTGTKSKCNCLACMKPCGLFFCPKKKPTEVGLTAIIIFY